MTWMLDALTWRQPEQNILSTHPQQTWTETKESICQVKPCICILSFLRGWMTSCLCEVYCHLNYETCCFWISTYILFTIFLTPMYPFFCSDLDPDLRTAFDEYLKTRLGGSLLKFLIEHMHRKEQNQYVNWLQKLQEMVSNGESSSPA